MALINIVWRRNREICSNTFPTQNIYKGKNKYKNKMFPKMSKNALNCQKHVAEPPLKVSIFWNIHLCLLQISMQIISQKSPLKINKCTELPQNM